MKVMRISGVVVFILGIAMFLFSNYIAEQVSEGRKKIKSAEKTVKQGNSLFSLTPVTKELGKQMTGSAQGKIDAGKKKVSDYDRIANQLHIGGIVFMVAGIGLFSYSFKKKRSR